MTSQQDKKNSQVLDEKIVDVLQKWKGSRRLVIVVVAIGLLLDNMLLTSVGKKNYHSFVCFNYAFIKISTKDVL